MEDLKREKLDCFKLCFRVKVADAIHYEQLKQKERDFEESNPGQVYKDSEEYTREIETITSNIGKNRTFIISFIKSS